MRETKSQEVAIQNVADKLIGFLKKCTLNDAFVVFNLWYAKENGSRRVGNWSTKALFH